MATVYSTTLTDSTGTSSGPLSVSSYKELWISFNVSAVSWIGSALATISRIDASNALYPLVEVQLSDGLASVDIGVGLANNVCFGDQVQIDVACASGTNISTTISVIGK